MNFINFFGSSFECFLLFVLTKLTILLAVVPLHFGFVDSFAKSIERFSHPDIHYYKPLLFDVPRFELLVGARDYILIISLNNFDGSHKRNFYMPPTNEKKEKCRIKGMKREECHNFITTLLPITKSLNYQDKQILVCGTNAYSPECEIRRLTDSFELVSKSISINAYCPFWNTTSLITSTGEFFYGGPLDLRGIDSSIIKQKKITLQTDSMESMNYVDRRIVRSAQHDSKWINADANFVFSFEFDKHVYFLFRETAIEHQNSEKRVSSRIGRVCKDDPGWRENWTSFLKTRINCSLPGAFPFYFDEIQSVDLIENGGTLMLYATFNTPENSIHGSAVCAFTMDSVLNAFRGAFKYQKSSNHIWESVNDDHSVFECEVSNSSESFATLRMNSVYQLMDQAVQSVEGRPFVVSTLENFKFIAVDLVKTKHHAVEIMFVTTNDGKLLKYARWPNMNDSCLIDEIQLVDPKDNEILSLKFLKDTQSLYFGTKKELIRVSVHRCHIHHTKSQCMESGDPYCGWSQTKMKCIPAPGNNHRDENWLQSELFKCLPRFGKWFDCNDANNNQQSPESCKCRKRHCSSVSDTCVDGIEIQVSNCTQNGGWSEWSPWSTCQPNCGKGMKSRTRTCNNPLPLNNGKACNGLDKEERQCDNLPSCLWGQWSEWTNCSQDCSSSSSKRTRQCLDFNGNPVDKDFCQGSFIETNVCDCRRTMEWTDWFISDLNTNEVVEQRNEVVMHRNNVRPKNEKRVISLKYCHYCGDDSEGRGGYIYNFNGKDFLIKQCQNCGDESISVWSEWSEWTRCVNGSQHRKRKCLLTDRHCDGHFQETRQCGFVGASEFRKTSKNAHYPHSQYDSVQLASASSSRIAIAFVLTAISSSCFTAIVFLILFYYQQKRNKPVMEVLMNPPISSEPNTYEEPEKYRISPSTPLNGYNHSTLTLTRSSTLKKNTSFRAKLDDSNY